MAMSVTGPVGPTGSLGFDLSMNPSQPLSRTTQIIQRTETAVGCLNREMQEARDIIVMIKDQGECEEKAHLLAMEMLRGKQAAMQAEIARLTQAMQDVAKQENASQILIEQEKQQELARIAQEQINIVQGIRQKHNELLAKISSCQSSIESHVRGSADRISEQLPAVQAAIRQQATDVFNKIS